MKYELNEGYFSKLDYIRLEQKGGVERKSKSEGIMEEDEIMRWVRWVVNRWMGFIEQVFFIVLLVKQNSRNFIGIIVVVRLRFFLVV